MRQSAYEKAFELLEEAKKGNKKTKLALCELYDCLEDCYKTEIEEEGEDEYDGDEESEEDSELGMRRSTRRGMRHHDVYVHGLRRGMRKHHSSRYSY